eukprot:7023793-Alexandrium_andersonii.AAC.1
MHDHFRRVPDPVSCFQAWIAATPPCVRLSLVARQGSALLRLLTPPKPPLRPLRCPPLPSPRGARLSALEMPGRPPGACRSTLRHRRKTPLQGKTGNTLAPMAAGSSIARARSWHTADVRARAVRLLRTTPIAA